MKFPTHLVRGRRSETLATMHATQPRQCDEAGSRAHPRCFGAGLDLFRTRQMPQSHAMNGGKTFGGVKPGLAEQCAAVCPCGGSARYPSADAVRRRCSTQTTLAMLSIDHEAAAIVSSCNGQYPTATLASVMIATMVNRNTSSRRGSTVTNNVPTVRLSRAGRSRSTVFSGVRSRLTRMEMLKRFWQMPTKMVNCILMLLDTI